ncbi:MAG: SPASM domain-containing protein, partial [Polyangiaceae bacterium]|nr:SPASM domain-containing protein [Polyangiaceae bacterium]
FRAGAALPLEPMHTKIFTHLKGGIPCPSRCMLGGTEMTVTPTGRIYPCAQMVGEATGGELVIGHVDYGMQLDKIRELQRLEARVETTGEPCAIRERCQSHCGCRHVALTGKLGEITATLCELEAAFIGAADAVAGQLFQEKCQTFLDLYYRKSWVPARGCVLTQLRRSRNA